MLHLTQLAAEMVIVMRAHFNNEIMLGPVQKPCWRTTGRILGLNVKKNISEKSRIQENDVNNFEFKHSSRIETEYCFLGRTQTAQ